MAGMTGSFLVAIGLLLSGAALAQPIVATPLPPPDEQSPTTQPTAPPKPAAPIWVTQGTAVVQALDKVNAQNATLTVKVGQTARFGSLTVLVRSCLVRPPDKAGDAAVFLEATDGREPGPVFAGWLVRSVPAVSMVQHPIYDLRVIGCAP